MPPDFVPMALAMFAGANPQVINLLLLASEIPERLLFLSEVESGCDPVILRELQRAAREGEWKLRIEAVPPADAQLLQGNYPPSDDALIN